MEFLNVKCEVLTAVNMKITLFLDLTQCNLGKKWLRWREQVPSKCLCTYQTIRGHIPEDG
jgi:hypothetical protein